MNEEKLIESISTINDTIFHNLNNTEKLLIISNILLEISMDYLPNDLNKDRISVVSNGKSVAYELMKHVDNNGLNLAMKAHHIIDIANKVSNEF